MEVGPLEDYLHAHIPLSAAMATSVVEAGTDRVVLEAPLAPNLNHRATAFGGSVSALAILAGWALVHVRLRHDDIRTHTVVQRSDVAYLHPVDDVFQARAAAPEEEAWARFVRSLRRWGRGRIRVRVEVHSRGVLAATLGGDYVALLSDEE